jgi:hypothetical protein
MIDSNTTVTTVQNGFNLSMLPNFLFLLTLFGVMVYFWYRYEYKPYKDDDNN